MLDRVYHPGNQFTIWLGIAVVIEKTGHKDETQALFTALNEFKVLQFIRSGRVALTRDPFERLSEFLRERDAFLDAMD